MQPLSPPPSELVIAYQALDKNLGWPLRTGNKPPDPEDQLFLVAMNKVGSWQPQEGKRSFHIRWLSGEKIRLQSAIRLEPKLLAQEPGFYEVFSKRALDARLRTLQTEVQVLQYVDERNRFDRHITDISPVSARKKREMGAYSDRALEISIDEMTKAAAQNFNFDPRVQPMGQMMLSAGEMPFVTLREELNCVPLQIVANNQGSLSEVFAGAEFPVPDAMEAAAQTAATIFLNEVKSPHQVLAEMHKSGELLLPAGEVVLSEPGKAAVLTWLQISPIGQQQEQTSGAAHTPQM